MSMTGEASQEYGGVPQEQVQRLLRFRSGHLLRHLEASSARWEYISCGSGAEHLLILPGGLRVAESAFPYIELFEASYRLIVPTYPPLMQIDPICDGIAAILDEEGVASAHVLGQSYGGMVAQVFVLRHPQLVKKLVLSGTAPLVSSGLQTATLNLLAALAALLPPKLALGLYKAMLGKVISVPPDQRLFWNAYLDDLFAHRLGKGDVLSHLRTGQDTVRKYRLQPGQRSSWQGPTLVIGGEKDPASTASDRHGLMQAYRQAELHVVAGAGHTPAMQRPQEYAARVKEFLR
jgi:pimeloyl-ACP methyl ester carboxylesterase